MFPVVQFPEIVKHYSSHFSQVFSAEALIEFERYISGLIVSENKTVDGINRLVVEESRNQSSLNRLLSESPFSLKALNQARLSLLQSVAGTQLKAYGVMSIDDTLLTHYGQHFEGIAWLYDHSSGSYTWAHNLVTLHYSDDQTDYPLLFQLWKPIDPEKMESGLQQAGIPLKAEKLALKTSQPDKWRQYLWGVWNRRQNRSEVSALYASKLIIAKQLLHQWVSDYPEAHYPVAFDTWYTQAPFLNYLVKELHLDYVGTLGEKEIVMLNDGEQTLGDFARQLKERHVQALQQDGQPIFKTITIHFKGGKETYYTYCHSHRLRGFAKQRLVITHRQRDLADDPVFYISNRRDWQALGITRIRRHRWPVEVYHEEGKAEGLDQYQVRSAIAIERHIALVAVVYCLLRAAQHDPILRDKLQRQLKQELEGSPAFWRRVTQAQSLWNLALLISAGVAQGLSLHAILQPLIRAMAHH
jgi:hypothetical protein